jgi:predicted MFS family arabinose efflux permease
MWVLAAAMLINRAGTMVLPFLVLYLTHQLGFAASTAGLALAVFGGGALFASVVGGRLCDRLGSGLVMEVSLVSSALILLLFPLARGTTAVMGATLAFALAGEAFRPACLVAVSECVEPEQRKTAFALARLAVNLGMSVGPAAGGFLAGVSFPALFWMDGATSLIAAGVLIFVRRRIRGAKPNAAGETARDGRTPAAPPAHRDPRLVLFMAALVPVAIVFFQHTSAMALFMVRDLGLAESAYGLMFTLNTLMIVALEVPLNVRMAGWPHRRTLALGSALIAVGFGSMAFVSGVRGIVATVVVWTFGEMILLPGLNAYVSDIAPRERSGAYMGLYTMVFSGCFVIGPWLGMVLLGRFGKNVLWGTMFVLGAVAAAMMSRLPTPDRAAANDLRNTSPSEPPPEPSAQP